MPDKMPYRYQAGLAALAMVLVAGLEVAMILTGHNGTLFLGAAVLIGIFGGFGKDILKVLNRNK